MPVTEKRYPDWVQEQRAQGTTVKRKGGIKDQSGTGTAAGKNGGGSFLVLKTGSGQNHS